MPHYIKKPIIIEAFRLGQKGNPTPAPEWFPSPSTEDITEDGIIIHTLEGNHLARWGDYIIKGIKGELYPCKPDIFEMTYSLSI